MWRRKEGEAGDSVRVTFSCLRLFFDFDGKRSERTCSSVSSLHFFLSFFALASRNLRERKFARASLWRVRDHQNHAAALHARPSEAVGLRARCETEKPEHSRARTRRRERETERERQNRRANGRITVELSVSRRLSLSTSYSSSRLLLLLTTRRKETKYAPAFSQA